VPPGTLTLGIDNDSALTARAFQTWDDALGDLQTQLA
jgi:hypothetical protein